jgi:hypothetical protein
MSDNQDPLTMLQKIIEKPEGAEPVQNSADDKQDQQVQSQEEIAAQEKRMVELKAKEVAKSAEDEVKIAETREEFSQVIGDADQESTDQLPSEGDDSDQDREEIHKIAQLKRLD